MPTRAASFVFFSAIVAAMGAGCARDIVLEARFASEGIRRATTRLESFLFPVPEGEEGQICGRMSPLGAPPVDVPTRSGLTASFENRGPRAEDVARFEGVPNGTWAVAIDAYGQRCRMEAASPDGNETVCVTYEGGEASVLRAHGCELISDEDLGSSTFALRTTAPIGSRMRDPVGLYDSAEDPLPIVEGLVARDDFVVQLVNDRADEANGVAVNWSIGGGSGSVEGPASRETAFAIFDTPESNAIEAEGISSALVRAGVTGSEIRDDAGAAGRIRVQAHAPGFEGSPIVFEARAVRGVEVASEAILFEAARDVRAPRFHPVVVDDLDRDGRAEIVLARAEGVVEAAISRLVVLTRDTAGALRAVVSDPIPGELTHLVSFQRDASGARALAVFSAAGAAQRVDLPGGGSRREIADPGVQLFRLEQGRLVAEGARMTTEQPCPTGACTATPMTKMVVFADPGDLDADGTEELVVSRCSFSESGGFPTDPNIDCYSPYSTGQPLDNNSEASVLAFEGRGAATAVRRVSSFQSSDLEGYRRRGSINEVRFADVNGDGRLDIVFIQPLITVGLCGNGQVERGYGFASGEQVPFDISTTIANSYSLAIGRFTDDARQDVITGGGLRAASGFAGVALVPSEQCSFGISGNELDIGPPTLARSLAFRSRDLNQDGYDDVVALHLEQGELRTFFGTGTRQLARGPTIAFGERHLSNIGVGGDGDGALVATYEPVTGRVLIVNLRPRS